MFFPSIDYCDRNIWVRKTQALKCLEDMGYFCVDNLPPALFQKFTELCLQPEKDVKKVALGIDIRERAFLMIYLLI